MLSRAKWTPEKCTNFLFPAATHTSGKSHIPQQRKHKGFILWNASTEWIILMKQKTFILKKLYGSNSLENCIRKMVMYIKIKSYVIITVK